jgi:hypothetical protein
VKNGKTLTSFGVNPGGYVGFFDPELGEHDTFSRAHDTVAKKRMQIKAQAALARRAMRYKHCTDPSHKHRRPAAALTVAASPTLKPRGKKPAAKPRGKSPRR